MANLDDAVLPILRKIQIDISEMRADIARLGNKVAELTERLDKFEYYFVHLLGMAERNTLDIRRLDEDVRAMKERVTRLEPQT